MFSTTVKSYQSPCYQDGGLTNLTSQESNIYSCGQLTILKEYDLPLTDDVSNRKNEIDFWHDSENIITLQHWVPKT